MQTVPGPLPPPDVKWHRHEREYILSLLERAKLSQRGAAKVLGLNERTMRYYCSGEQETPYLVQYALEVLAHQAGVHERADNYGSRPPQAWHEAKDRPLSKGDAGQIIVGFDKHGSLIAGELAADDFGVAIRSSSASGVDSHAAPGNVVERYVLVRRP